MVIVIMVVVVAVGEAAAVVMFLIVEDVKLYQIKVFFELIFKVMIAVLSHRWMIIKV